MKVHLVDGTYELFRQHFGQPARTDRLGREVAATRGVLSSVVRRLEAGATHIGVALDGVVESFRNAAWPGYKTSDGMPPALLAQLPLVAEALAALGVEVWSMVSWEADDALGPAAAIAERDPAVREVRIESPDKDFGQCVRGTRVVQVRRDRGVETVIDEAAVVARFGVPPAAVPDWLALVGDSADGFPGLPGWGPATASAVLGAFGSLEAIPDDPASWPGGIRGAARLASGLASGREDARRFRELATLRLDAPVSPSVERWRWRGPRPGFPALAAWLGLESLVGRVAACAEVAGHPEGADA